MSKRKTKASNTHRRAKRRTKKSAVPAGFDRWLEILQNESSLRSMSGTQVRGELTMRGFPESIVSAFVTHRKAKGGHAEAPTPMPPPVKSTVPVYTDVPPETVLH